MLLNWHSIPTLTVRLWDWITDFHCASFCFKLNHIINWLNLAMWYLSELLPFFMIDDNLHMSLCASVSCCKLHWELFKLSYSAWKICTQQIKLFAMLQCRYYNTSMLSGVFSIREFLFRLPRAVCGKKFSFCLIIPQGKKKKKKEKPLPLTLSELCKDHLANSRQAVMFFTPDWFLSSHSSIKTWLMITAEMVVLPSQSSISAKKLQLCFIPSNWPPHWLGLNSLWQSEWLNVHWRFLLHDLLLACVNMRQMVP